MGIDRTPFVTLPPTSSTLPNPDTISTMKRLTTVYIAVFALVVAACGTDDPPAASEPPQTQGPAPTGAAPTTVAVPPTTVSAAPTTTNAPQPRTTVTSQPAADPEALFAITAVNLTAAGQHIVIQNVGDAPGNLQGYALCQAPNYAVLGDLELAPGEFVAISVGGSLFLPPPGAAHTASASIGDVSIEDGEIGLYSRAGAFSSSSAIVDYVEWGSTGHRRSSVASEAGIWNSGDFVDLSGAESAFLFAVTLPTDGAEDWDFQSI